MLILTRKEGELIRIGDNITVKVVDAGNGYVKLGIEAPGDVTILRQEVYDRISEENVSSAESGQLDIGSIADLWKKNET